MTTYAQDLQAALKANFGAGWITYMPKWNVVRSTEWRGGGKPKALVLHHTAAASTSSVNPAAPGNQKGADQGVVDFIQSHYPVPAANFTLLRWGGIVVHCAYPVWHAGLGSFHGKHPWSTLGIPDNLGNNYMLGVEVMDRGVGKTFTEAQKDSLKYLMRACRDASGWRNTAPVYRPRHCDWTDRKVDIRYTNEEVTEWMQA